MRYEAANRLTSLAQSGTGLSDEALAKSGVPPVSFSLAYDPTNGHVESIANVDTGIGAAYVFDVMDRPTDITWHDGQQGVIRSFAMTWNNADMITRIDQADGTYRVYSYDSLDRLTGEQHFDAADALLYSASYSYDLAGNRTQTIINNVTHTYTLAQTGDRLVSWGVNGENTLTYDAAGNVTQRVVAGKPTLDLAWDLEYRLTQVTSGGNPVESYQYDPTGRRIKTVNAGGTIWHVNDGAHLLLSQHSIMILEVVAGEKRRTGF